MYFKDGALTGCVLEPVSILQHKAWWQGAFRSLSPTGGNGTQHKLGLRGFSRETSWLYLKCFFSFFLSFLSSFLLRVTFIASLPAPHLREPPESISGNHLPLSLKHPITCIAGWRWGSQQRTKKPLCGLILQQRVLQREKLPVWGGGVTGKLFCAAVRSPHSWGFWTPTAVSQNVALSRTKSPESKPTLRAHRHIPKPRTWDSNGGRQVGM